MSNELNPLMETLIQDVELLDAKSTISIQIDGNQNLLGVEMDIPKELLLDFLKAHGNQIKNIHTTATPKKVANHYKTRKDVLEMVIDAVYETLDIRKDQQTITENTNLTNDLSMDSLVAMEFIFVLENKLDIRWPIDDPTYMTSFRTVKEVADSICHFLEIKE